MLVLPFADDASGSTDERSASPPPKHDQPNAKAATGSASQASRQSNQQANQQAQAPEEEQEQASVGAEINVMLALLLPWAISVLLHLGLALLAFFVVWSAATEEEEDKIIPEAQMLNDRPSELLVYSEDLEVEATTEIPREIETQTVAKGDPLSAVQTETATDMALIGVSGSKALPAGSRIGKDPFGVGMYGAGGNARTIVYVIDASGSLVDTLPFAIDELKNSLRNLIPEQRFSVVFFQESRALYPFPGMKPATAQNIKAVSQWLDSDEVVPHGSSNPKKALQIALSYRPDLIYILSDNITGDDQYAIDQKELLQFIEEHKQRKGAAKTRINTIQFLYPDPLDTLEKIAEKHEGEYRYVDASVVGTR
ncbi:MAG: hypothetical protein GVY24_06945 [Planctomycetes bacterium]|jgi:hypothetical protein|nr:hypothetical protein [Planctomycetota bacterium]